MANFEYRAVSTAGTVSSGVITANDEGAALQALRAKQMRVLSLKTSSGLPRDLQSDNVSSVRGRSTSRRKMRRGGSAKLSSNDVSARQRKTSLKTTSCGSARSWVCLSPQGYRWIKPCGSRSIARVRGPWRDTLLSCLDSLKSGKSFSAALEGFPSVFAPFYINMVRSGEASGNLAQVLTDLGAFLERKKALRASVVSALTYPLILLSVATLSVFIMLGFVVPEFEALFDDMGDSLPILTRIIVALGDAVSEWGWVLLALTMFLLWFLRRWLNQPTGGLAGSTGLDNAANGPFGGEI